MNRPVVIIDPLSSGTELAPAFKARGVPAIAVKLNFKEWPEFGSKMHSQDFLEVIPLQEGLEEIIAKYNPIAIIPGTEEGIALAEKLIAHITPELGNDPTKSRHRAHKALMQEALSEAGVPTLKTIYSRSEQEVEKWIADLGFKDRPLIVKPPVSSGSEKVFHIEAGADWKKAFNHVLAEPVISGRKSETAVVQQQAIGTEYAVGTVSAHGKHYLAHLIKYNKTTSGQHKTVYDFVEFVPFDEQVLGELWDYVKRALDALGVRFGATHTEIMLTADGPRLIETSTRLIGGPVVGFARVATGSSQVDKLVEIYVDGDVQTKGFVFKKAVVPVFLKSPRAGISSNLDVFDEAAQLPTLLKKYIWFKNGDRVPQTIDYLTSIGIIALTGELKSIFKDFKKIRAMESRLEVT